MTKLFKIFTRIDALLIVIIIVSTFEFTRAGLQRHPTRTDISADDDDDDDSDKQGEIQPYDLKQLRRFLLTANAEQRAERRRHEDRLKQQLIQEYLQAVANRDSSQFQEIKKRFKTYCNSYEDLMHSNWATCG